MALLKNKYFNANRIVVRLPKRAHMSKSDKICGFLFIKTTNLRLVSVGRNQISSEGSLRSPSFANPI